MLSIVVYDIPMGPHWCWLDIASCLNSWCGACVMKRSGILSAEWTLSSVRPSPLYCTKGLTSQPLLTSCKTAVGTILFKGDSWSSAVSCLPFASTASVCLSTGSPCLLWSEALLFFCDDGSLTWEIDSGVLFWVWKLPYLNLPSHLWADVLWGGNLRYNSCASSFVAMIVIGNGLFRHRIWCLSAVIRGTRYCTSGFSNLFGLVSIHFSAFCRNLSSKFCTPGRVACEYRVPVGS